MKDSVNQTSASGVCTVPLGKPVCRSGRDWYEVEAYATPDAHLLTPKEYVVAVRAVNSHAELTSVLRLSAAAFDSIANGIPNHEIYAAKCAETVREVLARLAEATK